jgi:3-deoxy-7-phosphoheptulonate synthase
MLVVMKKEATPEQVARVVKAIERLGLSAHPIPGVQRTAIGITGNKGSLDPNALESLDGVLEAIPVSKPFKQVSREWREDDTIVDVAGVKIGGRAVVIIGGPCAVESYEQCREVARAVKDAGASILRGGAF